MRFDFNFLLLFHESFNWWFLSLSDKSPQVLKTLTRILDDFNSA